MGGASPVLCVRLVWHMCSSFGAQRSFRAPRLPGGGCADACVRLSGGTGLGSRSAAMPQHGCRVHTVHIHVPLGCRIVCKLSTVSEPDKSKVKRCNLRLAAGVLRGGHVLVVHAKLHSNK